MIWLRTLALWLAASALLLGGTPRLLTGVGTGATFADTLVAGCQLALLGCAGWAWLAVTAVVVEVLRGHPNAARRSRAVPRPLRRAVLLACGVALTTSGTAIADTPQDAPRDASYDASYDAPAEVLLAGLPYPARAHDATAPAATAPGATALGATGATVTVRPGDSLWSIAARRLPRGASDAAVARTSALLHRLNRDVIGDDPDLIHPGQRLRLPDRTLRRPS
ncbi:MAG TPA: LysM peptidoglycan-binding domain-containing protein [Nocardioides sp.]|uniref:LysM peptidoglycan-binding domain-containing protein n=1 Tax=Nocardioides sp. TaxID=35761 RepID=UPI002EDB9DDF